MTPSLKRLLSAATLFFFTLASPVSALPAGGVEVALQGISQAFVQIEIPSELASVEEIYEAPARPDSKLVLHIQNVHGHYEAQEQIKKLLNYLHEKYAFNLIFVEGASEKLNPDLLRMFPDQQLNTELVEYLAKMGELTGPELFLMNAPEQIEAIGIEKTSLYRTNYESFKAVHNAKPETEKLLQATAQNLDSLSSRFFSPEARRILGEWKKFEAGHRDFLPYIQSLAKDSKKILGMDLTSLFAQVEWPQITRLLVLQSMEKDLDKVKAEAEKEKVISFLRSKKVSEKVIEAIGKLGERRITMSRLDSAQERLENLPRYLLERLAEEAGPRGFQFHDYPSFSLYAGYLILQSELDSRELFHEIELLFEKILSELTPSEREKNLIELFRDQELLAKLLKLELSRKEWSRADYRKEWIKPQTMLERLDAIEKQSDEKTASKNAAFDSQSFLNLNSAYEQALLFYQYATRREDAFFEKIRNEMKERKTDKAVLVTGGFHTDGMMDLFRANDMSYGILMPRLQQKIDNVNYLASMLENATTPFDIANIEMINRIQNIEALQDLGLDVEREVHSAILAFAAVAKFKTVDELKQTIEYFNQSAASRNLFGLRFDLKINDAGNPAAISVTAKQGILDGFDIRLEVTSDVIENQLTLRPKIRRVSIPEAASRAELRTAGNWQVDPQTLLALKRGIEGLDPDKDTKIITALSAAFNERGVPDALRTSPYRPNVGAKPKSVRDRVAGLLSNVSTSPTARPYGPAEALFSELLRLQVIDESGLFNRAELRTGEKSVVELKNLAGQFLGNIFSGLTLEQVIDSEAGFGVRELPEGQYDPLNDSAVDFKRQVLNLLTGNAAENPLLSRIQAKRTAMAPTQIPETRISLFSVVEAVKDSQLADVEIRTLMRMIARAKLVQLGVVSGLNDGSIHPPSYNRPSPNLGSVRITEMILDDAIADIQIFDRQLRSEIAEVRRHADVLDDNEINIKQIGRSKALVELAIARRTAREVIQEVFPQVTLRDLLDTHRDRVAIEEYRYGDGRHAFSEPLIAQQIMHLSEDLSLQDLVMHQTSNVAQVDAYMRMALRHFMTQHRWIDDSPQGMLYTNPFNTQFGMIDVRNSFEWAPLIGDVRTRLQMNEANQRISSARNRPGATSVIPEDAGIDFSNRPELRGLIDKALITMLAGSAAVMTIQAQQSDLHRNVTTATSFMGSTGRFMLVNGNESLYAVNLQLTDESIKSGVADYPGPFMARFGFPDGPKTYSQIQLDGQIVYMVKKDGSGIRSADFQDREAGVSEVVRRSQGANENFVRMALHPDKKVFFTTVRQKDRWMLRQYDVSGKLLMTSGIDTTGMAREDHFKAGEILWIDSEHFLVNMSRQVLVFSYQDQSPRQEDLLDISGVRFMDMIDGNVTFIRDDPGQFPLLENWKLGGDGRLQKIGQHRLEHAGEIGSVSARFVEDGLQLFVTSGNSIFVYLQDDFGVKFQKQLDSVEGAKLDEMALDGNYVFTSGDLPNGFSILYRTDTRQMDKLEIYYTNSTGGVIAKSKNDPNTLVWVSYDGPSTTLYFDSIVNGDRVQKVHTLENFGYLSLLRAQYAGDFVFVYTDSSAEPSKTPFVPEHAIMLFDKRGNLLDLQTPNGKFINTFWSDPETGEPITLYQAYFKEGGNGLPDRVEAVYAPVGQEENSEPITLLPVRRPELRANFSRSLSMAAALLLPWMNFAAEVPNAQMPSQAQGPRLASPPKAEFTPSEFADYVMGPRNPSYVFNTGIFGGFTPFINFWGDSVIPMAANDFSWLATMFAENTQPLFNESGYLAPGANLNILQAAESISWAGDSPESFRMQGASAFALGLSRVGLDSNDWGVVYTGKIFMRPVGGRFGVSAPALFDGYFKIIASTGFQKLFTSPEYVFDLQPRVVNEFGMSEVGDGIPDTTFADGVGEMFGIWYKAWQERYNRPEPIPGAFNLAVVAEEVRTTLEAAIAAAVEKNANPDGTISLDGLLGSVSSTLSLNAGIPLGGLEIKRLDGDRAIISATVPTDRGINSVQPFYSTTVNGARNPGGALIPVKGGDLVEIEVYTGPFGVNQAFFTLVGYRQQAPEGSGPKLMRQELRSKNGVLSNLVSLGVASAAMLNVPPISAQQTLAMNTPIVRPNGIELQVRASSQDFRKLDFLYRSDLSANWTVVGDDVAVDSSGTTSFLYAAAANPQQGFFAVEGTPKVKNTVFDKTQYAKPAYEASIKSYLALIDPNSGIVVNQSSGQFFPGNWWFKSSDPGAEWMLLLLAAYNHERVPIGQDSSPENVSKLLEKSITSYLNLVDRFGLTVRNQSGELVNTGIPSEVYVNSGAGQFRPEKLTFAFYDAGITLDSLDYVYQAAKQGLIPGLNLSEPLVERIGNYLNRTTFSPFFDESGILHQTVTTDNTGRIISRSGAIVNQKDNEVLAFIFSLIDRGMLSDLPVSASLAERKADGSQWFRGLAMPYRMIRSGKSATLTPVLGGDFAISGLTSGLYANAAYDLSRLAPGSLGLAVSNYANVSFYQNGMKEGFPVVFSVPSKAYDNQSQYVVSGLFNPTTLAPAGAALGLSLMNSDARVITNFNTLMEKGQSTGSFSTVWGFPDSLNPQTLAAGHQGRTTQNIAFGIFGQNFELLQDWNAARPSYDFAREEFGQIDLKYAAPTNAPLIDLAARASQRGIFTAKANYPNNKVTYDPNTGNLSVSYNLHPTENPFSGVYLKMSGVRLTGRTVLTVSIGNNSLGQMAFEFKDSAGKIISKVYSPLTNDPFSFLNFDIPGSGNVAETTIVFSSSTIGTNQKGSVDFLNFYLHEPGRQELRAGKFERFATPDEARELGQIKTMGDRLVQLLNETISKVRASVQQESSARKASLDADLQAIRSQIAGISALLDGMSRENNPAYTNLAKGHPFSETDMKQPITVLDMYLQAEGSLEEILQQPDRLEQLRIPLVSVMENIGRLADQQFLHVDRSDAVTAYIRFEPKQIVVQAPEKADSPVITKEGTGVPSAPTKGVILVVDDEPTMRMAIKRVLGASGYVVHTAVHGRDALDKIRGGLMPQVVITDMNMPEMGGEELITTLGGKIPSILISGYVGNAAAELESHRANGVPVDAVFGKPFDNKTMEAKIDELIQARSGDEGRAELRTAEGNYLESAVQLGDRRVVASLGQVSWDVAAEVAGFVLGERDAQAALAFNRAISDSLALSNPLQSIIGQATETILTALALPSDTPNPGSAMGVVLAAQGTSSESVSDLLAGIGPGVGRVYLIGRGAPKQLTQGLSAQGIILTPLRRMNEPSLNLDGSIDQQGGVIPTVMLDGQSNLVMGNRILPVWGDMGGITDPEIGRLVLKIQARLTSKLARILRANPALLKDQKALLGELVKAATLGNEFDFQSLLEFTTRNGRAELRVSGQGVQKFITEFAARAEIRKAA